MAKHFFLPIFWFQSTSACCTCLAVGQTNESPGETMPGSMVQSPTSQSTLRRTLILVAQIALLSHFLMVCIKPHLSSSTILILKLHVCCILIPIRPYQHVWGSIVCCISDSGLADAQELRIMVLTDRYPPDQTPTRFASLCVFLFWGWGIHTPFKRYTIW